MAFSGKAGARHWHALGQATLRMRRWKEKKRRGRERRGKKKVSVALEALALDRNGSNTSDPCLGGRLQILQVKIRLS